MIEFHTFRIYLDKKPIGKVIIPSKDPARACELFLENSSDIELAMGLKERITARLIE